MMDLDQLFTVTDYKTTTIRIPCGSLDSNESENEQEYLTKELSIDLFNSQAASTDYDLTGQILWPVSGKEPLLQRKSRYITACCLRI
jgi:hypothetical protein